LGDRRSLNNNGRFKDSFWLLNNSRLLNFSSNFRLNYFRGWNNYWGWSWLLLFYSNNFRFSLYLFRQYITHNLLMINYTGLNKSTSILFNISTQTSLKITIIREIFQSRRQRGNRFVETRVSRITLLENPPKCSQLILFWHFGSGMVDG
jgi:hypothetical protein